MSESASTASLPAESRVLPWHGAQRGQLLKLLAAGRLPHAVLLEGATGSGRNLFAEAFARELLCMTPTAAGNCGTCKACTLTAAGSHADLFRLEPTEPGRAIGIDSIRKAIEFCAETASLGTRKVLLVSPLENMTRASFNAFLKCLEEPAAGTFMLLVAARGRPLPATIRSRCQRWVLPSPTPEEGLAWLEERMEGGALEDLAGSATTGAKSKHASREALEQVLRLSGEGPVEALGLLQSDELPALLALDTLCSNPDQAAAAGSLAVETAAAEIDPDRLLDYLEQAVVHGLRQRGADELRSAQGLSLFKALDELRRLRAARQAGSNPNPDLLRFHALQASRGLWAA